MNIPTTTIDNLNFPEAIRLAELTERVHQFVGAASVDTVQAHANALANLAGWRAIYTVYHARAKAWAFILQQEDSAHFAIVCGYGGLDGQATASPSATPATPIPQAIPVTNDPLTTDALTLRNQLGVDKLWRALQERLVDHAVAYRSADNAASGRDGSAQAAAPEQAKVYQPWLTACQAIQDEIDLFFRALSGLKFVQPQLEQLRQRTPQQQADYRAALGAALQLRFGAEASQAQLMLFDQGLIDRAKADAVTGSISLPLFASEQSALPHWHVPAAGLKLTFTGHGAGGAVALLCALHLKSTWESHLDFPIFHCQTYTFGSPKVGNQAFVDYYNQQMPGCSYRIQNLLDGVTYGPLDEFLLPQSLAPLQATLQAWRLPKLLFQSAGDYWRAASALGANLGQLGDRWISYAHIGEAFCHPGVGNAPAPFNFALGIKPLILPFAHDPAGYKALLIDAQTQYKAISAPVRALTEKFETDKNRVTAVLLMGIKQAQAWLNRLQGSLVNR